MISSRRNRSRNRSIGSQPLRAWATWNSRARESAVIESSGGPPWPSSTIALRQRSSRANTLRSGRSLSMAPASSPSMIRAAIHQSRRRLLRSRRPYRVLHTWRKGLIFSGFDCSWSQLSSAVWYWERTRLENISHSPVLTGSSGDAWSSCTRTSRFGANSVPSESSDSSYEARNSLSVGSSRIGRSWWPASRRSRYDGRTMIASLSADSDSSRFTSPLCSMLPPTAIISSVSMIAPRCSIVTKVRLSCSSLSWTVCSAPRPARSSANCSRCSRTDWRQSSRSSRTQLMAALEFEPSNIMVRSRSCGYRLGSWS